MSCKLNVVVSLLRILATLLSLRPFGIIEVLINSSSISSRIKDTVLEITALYLKI